MYLIYNYSSSIAIPYKKNKSFNPITLILQLSEHSSKEVVPQMLLLTLPARRIAAPAVLANLPRSTTTAIKPLNQPFSFLRLLAHLLQTPLYLPILL